MIGNLRYLTADAEVLHEWAGIPRRNECAAFIPAKAPDDERLARIIWAALDDLCVWDATCTPCKDVESAAAAWARDPMAFAQGCPTCKGTGVDETIPTHLVGIGSRLRDARDGTDHLVIARAENNIATRSIEDGRWLTRVVSQIGPGKPWLLVRPVPAAHISHTTTKGTR
jgi:hypothetical protein